MQICYVRPSALGMSDPLMDQGNQVDQGDQSGTSISKKQVFLGTENMFPGTEHLFPGTENLFSYF